MIWDIKISDEAVSFLLSILLGFFICFIYDIFRGVRRGGVGNSTAVVFWSDILFFAIISVVVFLFLIIRTEGTIRSYVFMGIAIGVELFLLTASKFVLILVELLTRKTVLFKRFLKTKINKAERKALRLAQNALKRLKFKKNTKKSLETAVDISV